MLSAGYARLRPVLMTAAAMILGMLPMALGLGEGGEQNAPLGRAVIGGLLGATVTTLFIVPIIYRYLRTKPPANQERRLRKKRWRRKRRSAEHAAELGGAHERARMSRSHGAAGGMRRGRLIS